MAKDGADTLFLPDFCDIRMVFAVVLAGQLLALLLALVSLMGTDEGWGWWQRLGLLSVFIQWLGLSSAGVLCVGRRWLKVLGDARAGLASYLLVLIVCAVLSELAYWLIVNRLVVLDWSGFPSLFGPDGPVEGGHWVFFLRNMCIAAIVAAVTLRYLYVQHQWKQQVEAEARARIQALQSRIRPHFLFNSMNTIASLTRSNPELAEQVTEDLAELFRESLGEASIPTTLEREFEIGRQYLRIEKQRLGGRLEVRWRVGDLPGDALIPRLTLQPLLENAVYHGIEPALDGGEIVISGQGTDKGLRIEISNPLPEPGDGLSRKGNRLAQANVSERLQAYFGLSAQVSVEQSLGTYTVVLELPRRSGPA